MNKGQSADCCCSFWTQRFWTKIHCIVRTWSKSKGINFRDFRAGWPKYCLLFNMCLSVLKDIQKLWSCHSLAWSLKYCLQKKGRYWQKNIKPHMLKVWSDKAAPAWLSDSYLILARAFQLFSQRRKYLKAETHLFWSSALVNTYNQ